MVDLGLSLSASRMPIIHRGMRMEAARRRKKRLTAYESDSLLKAVNHLPYKPLLSSLSLFIRQALEFHSLPGGYMKRDREGKV